MAAAAAASVWLLQQLPPHSRPHNSLLRCPPAPVYKKKRAVPGPLPVPGRGNLLLLCTASSSSDPAFLSYKDDPNFRGCRGCGRDELERGCNGQGFGWWPIKAYRPCPGFVASGGRYRRQGQSMDDVASGRGKKPKPLSAASSATKNKSAK